MVTGLSEKAMKSRRDFKSTDFSGMALYFDQVPETMGGIGYLSTLNSIADLRQARGESPSSHGCPKLYRRYPGLL